MKTITLLLTSAAVFLTGCGTPAQSPPELAHVQLERVDSRAVRIVNIRLVREDGRLVIRGSVRKQGGAITTTHTHLDVSFYNDAGQMLLHSMEGFVPYDIKSRLNRPVVAHYRVALDSLPAGTTRIEVRAHEGGHPTTARPAA